MNEETRTQCQEHLDALSAFMGSRAYVGWKAANEATIESLSQRILDFDPISREDEIESFKLRGELRREREASTTFEDAVRTLKDRINTLLDLESKSGTNRTVI